MPQILWKHIEAYYCMTGNLKFYLSWRTYSIQRQAGTHQGDPLGTVLFSAPSQQNREYLHVYSNLGVCWQHMLNGTQQPSLSRQPLLNRIANTYTIHLRLKPAAWESFVFIPNPTQLQHNYATLQFLQTPMGLRLPSTIDAGVVSTRNHRGCPARAGIPARSCQTRSAARLWPCNQPGLQPPFNYCEHDDVWVRRMMMD